MSPLKNLEDGRYGYLTVIERDFPHKTGKSRWKCLCDCGNVKTISQSSLVSGNTRSCGCLNKQTPRNRAKLKGMRIGRLKVIEFHSVKKYVTYWKCLCDCGNIAIVRGWRLTKERTKSCGCLVKDINRKRLTTHGKTGTSEYATATTNKRRERKRLLDVQWTHEMEEALRDFQPFCVICGIEEILYTDHVYPLSKGYGLCPGNAIRLCKPCNSAKANKMPEELSDNRKQSVLRAAEEFRLHWIGTHVRPYFFACSLATTIEEI